MADKASFARNARETSSSVLDMGARRAAELVGGDRGLANVVVFNAAGWAGTDVVKVFLPFSTVPGDVEVAVEDDRDGTKIATRALPQEHVDHRPAGRFLQFLARDVPSLGYARFNVVEGSPAPVEVSQPGNAVVENEFYRVTYAAADASIASVLELATGQRARQHPGTAWLQRLRIRPLRDRHQSGPLVGAGVQPCPRPDRRPRHR